MQRFSEMKEKMKEKSVDETPDAVEKVGLMILPKSLQRRDERIIVY